MENKKELIEKITALLEKTDNEKILRFVCLLLAENQLENED